MINGLSKKILGLDIRSHTISAVLIKSSLKGLRFEGHATVDISDGLKNSENGFFEALKSVTTQLDTTGASCAVSFPFDQPSFRHLSVPFKEKRKIRQILPFEIEPLMPFSLDDVIIDFQAAYNEENTHQTDIIVGAVRRQELAYYLEGLKSLELDPETVTIGGYCTARVIAGGMDGYRDWCVIDIHRDTVTVSFCFSDQIRAFRTFRIPSGPGQRSLYILSRIYQTILAAGENRGGEIALEKIYLTAEGADKKNFEASISEKLNVPVEPLDVINIAGVDLINHSGDSKGKFQCQTALALCLSETHSLPVLNFRKGPFAKKKFWMEHTKDLIRSGSIAAVVLMLLGVGFIVESFTLENQASRLDGQIREVFKSTFPESSTTHAPLERMKAKIKELEKTARFSDETETSRRTIDIINDLSRLAPDSLDIKISKLSISSDALQISGDTGTFNMVDDLKGRLEASEIFTSVDITSANLNKSGNRVDFKLKLQME